MKRFRKQERNGELTPARECFFVLGWTWPFLDDEEYPFRDEEERAFLWEKYKEELVKKMRQDTEAWGEFRRPSGNNLRPAEWWLIDAPEAKKILNGATEKAPGIYDFQPLEESDFEYLSRLNLLTKEDLAYIETEQFKAAEKHFLEYRKYWFATETRGNHSL